MAAETLTKRYGAEVVLDPALAPASYKLDRLPSHAALSALGCSPEQESQSVALAAGAGEDHHGMEGRLGQRPPCPPWPAALLDRRVVEAFFVPSLTPR